jgi:PAS domain S-box-containing protein
MSSKGNLDLDLSTYKKILDSLPNPVFIKDKEGVYIYCNKEFLKISQQTEGNVIGHTVYDLLPKDKAKDLEKADKALLKDEKGKDFVIDLIDPDGNLRYVQFQRRVLKDGKNKLGVLGVMFDVTKQTINEERLQLALTATDEGLWDWYIPTNDVYYSPRWKDILGYKDDELKNSFAQWEKLIHPDDLEEAKSYIMNHVSGKIEGDLDLEFRMKHKDGSYRIIHSKALLVKSEKGKPTRMIGTHTDITAQRSNEEKLEIFYKGFVKSPDSMAVVEYKDNKPSIVDVNESFLEMYKYKREEAIGQNPRVLQSGQYDKDFYANMWKSIMDPKIGYWSGEIDNKDSEGELVRVILTINTIFDDGKPQRFLANHTDISELKDNIETLEEFNNAVVGRELKMIQLKEEIKELKEKVDILEKQRS